MSERRFPIQTRYGLDASIPWSLAERLYEDCGHIWHDDGSLEELARRGGWGTGELGTMLLGIDVMGRQRRTESLLDRLAHPQESQEGEEGDD